MCVHDIKAHCGVQLGVLTRLSAHLDRLVPFSNDGVC